MNELPVSGERTDTRTARIVRDACLRAAQDAYERASADGLCAEGAFECALDAIRSIDIQALIDQSQSPAARYR